MSIIGDVLPDCVESVNPENTLKQVQQLLTDVEVLVRKTNPNKSKLADGIGSIALDYLKTLSGVRQHLVDAHTSLKSLEMTAEIAVDQAKMKL